MGAVSRNGNRVGSGFVENALSLYLVGPEIFRGAALAAIVTL
jgi:hypothetical protein